KGNVIPKLSNVRNTDNKIDDITLQMDFTYMFDSKDEIGIGFHVKQINTDLFLENDKGVPTNLGSSGANITFYTKYKFLQLEWIGVDIGTRLNLTTISKNKNSVFAEPRLSFNLSIIPEISIKGAVGIFQQELTTLSD